MVGCVAAKPIQAERQHGAVMGGVVPSWGSVIERFCDRDDLATYDPYDIWSTSWGLRVKDFYNRHRLLGLVPAGVFALFDFYLNNEARRFYIRHEEPVVRAMAALCMMNLYGRTHQDGHLARARNHLLWLEAHAVRADHGVGWGLNFPHVVSKTVRHHANTPFTTSTPYCMEAFLKYESLTGEEHFRHVLDGILLFFDRDLVVMEETHDYLATSYAPMRDRIATNAVSYTMFALASLLDRVPYRDQERIRSKIRKLCRFILLHQRADGSWLYSPEGKSFIDCFHSCFVMKNLVKTDRVFPLPQAADSVQRGYDYVKRELYDHRCGLFRRFSVSNKPGLVKYDLYDNAEMLNLAILLDDHQQATDLCAVIDRHFRGGEDIYSLIDLFGCRKNKNTLRWAVMPYLYALSQTA